MSLIPLQLKEFLSVIHHFTSKQIDSILSDLSNFHTKLITEAIYNLLYNPSIKLSTTQKKKLKPFVSIYTDICNKHLSLKRKKKIISQNIPAIKEAIEAISLF